VAADGAEAAAALAAAAHPGDGNGLPRQQKWESAMFSVSRFLRHAFMTRFHVQQAFPKRVLKAIEAAIDAAEKSHGGEIRFALERELTTADLLRNVSPRQRAAQLFGELGVWDTENNNGVLIYVLLADHVVEVVADRGFAERVSAVEWAHACQVMEQAYRAGQFERGSVEGIAAVSTLIARHYPLADRNEQANAPVLL
jgi:hypothetical protein